MNDLFKKAAPFVPIVQEYATKYQVSPELMLGILAQESAFNPVAVGPPTKYGTAKGIAQFIDPTAQRFGVDPMNPRSAIEGQAKYLAVLGKLFNNDPMLMAAAYNAGEGAVQKAKGVPQFKETQNYVKRVAEFMPTFSELLGGADRSQKQVGIPQANPLVGLSNILAGVNPQTLVPETQSTMSGPLRTLLTTLATIGNLGGTTANIISAVKGNPGTGNEAIRQSGDLFGRIQKDQQVQQQQRDMAELAANPDLNPLLKAVAAIGGREALSSVAKSAAAESLPSNQLEMLRAQQLYEQNTPEGRARIAAEQRREAVETAKALAPYKGVGEERAATSVATNLRKEFNNIPEVKDFRSVEGVFQGAEKMYNEYLKDPAKKGRLLDDTLVIAFNKYIDPSVVKEGEFDRSIAGRAARDKLAGYVRKQQQGGQGFSQAERDDFINTMRTLRQGRLASIKPQIDFFTQEATRSGVDPVRVINFEVGGDAEPQPTKKTLEDYSMDELNGMSLEELRGLDNGK